VPTPQKEEEEEVSLSCVSTGSAVVPSYPRVLRSKTNCDYVKPRIILNVIYNVIFA
jgi:hypothetical protein